MEWLIPILASMAGSIASAGAGELLANDPAKPKPSFQKMNTTSQAEADAKNANIMQDDILQQYLSRLQRMGVA